MGDFVYRGDAAETILLEDLETVDLTLSDAETNVSSEVNNHKKRRCGYCKKLIWAVGILILVTTIVLEGLFVYLFNADVTAIDATLTEKLSQLEALSANLEALEQRVRNLEQNATNDHTTSLLSSRGALKQALKQ